MTSAFLALKLFLGEFKYVVVPFDQIFDAVAEATEESAFNALIAADTVEGRDGNILYGFPIDHGLAHVAKR